MIFKKNICGQSCRLMQEFISKRFTLKSFQNVYCTRARSYREKKLTIEPRGWVLLIVPIATFGLGTWQIQRRNWKLSLIQELQQRVNSEPKEFPEDILELNDIEYYPVKVRGEFDHSKELFMGPRTLIKDGKAATEGSLISKNTQNRTGYYVITPFHLSDKNMTILINRGWVPRDKRDPTSRSVGQIEGEVELVGLVRLNETREVFSPRNRGNIWFYRDLPKMAEATDAAPVLLDAAYESSVHGGPVGGQTIVTLRNEHLSYILTWYSLSAVTAMMWYRMFILR